MTRGTNLKFEGQKEFEQILKKIKCPRNIHEVYFFLRGMLAGTYMVKMADYFNWLFEGRKIEFDSEEEIKRFMNNFTGLWNLIAAAQHEGGPSPEIKSDFPDTVNGIKDRVKLINQKNKAFIKGLDLAGTDPMEMTPDGRAVFEALVTGNALFQKSLGVLKEESNPNELKKFVENVDKFEAIMEDCIQRISFSLDEARKTAIPGPVITGKGKKVDRNIPCLCGSGKKYKHCCWLRLH
ncbi:MAG: SEC-C domain-containing protein [Nitrospinae bacterium]|nr:SEC-C domain-containing protein [Nitrospinota bacterium]